MLPTARFYNPDGPDRVAEVAVEQATDPDFFLIQICRGPSAAALRHRATLGPYRGEQVPAQFDDAVRELRREGFWPAGLHALLSDLEDTQPAVRAHAAARLGWRRNREAVEKLLAVLSGAIDETCAVVDALGAIGDPRAIPAVRQQAARQLLSRRRSGVEALRNLGDQQGLNEARQRALERLPAPVRERLESKAPNPAALVQDVFALEVQHQGLAFDTLYELATPLTVAATREILRKVPFDRIHLWRYVKSVFKRSLLRHDHETFGWLAYAIEMRGRTTKGTVATVKSGHDGQQRSTRIFGRNTQDFLRRLSWRYLRTLACWLPEEYAHAAAEIVIHYRAEDVPAQCSLGTGFGYRYLLHRILLGGSKRFRFAARRMYFGANKAKVAANVREEAFPELWDDQPRAYLRVLSAARLAAAHVFAVRALKTTHTNLIQGATPAELVAMLRAPYEPTVELALAEMERRFDPAKPDWPLLDELLADERPMARQVGERWLRLTAALWAADPVRILALLTSKHPETRALVVEMTRGKLGREPELRRQLAPLVLAALQQPEAAPGIHDTLAQVVRESLTAELQALLTVPQLADWVARGSPSALALAGYLLASRPEAVRELGLERLTALAQHDVAAVRAAAHALLWSAQDALRADPSVLFMLVESDWDDTRSAAFDLLRQIDAAALGLDGIMGLLDSNRTDVQEVGRELAVKHLGVLPVEELVYRLVQHPHPGMRRFALELVVNHLPAGDGPLAKLKDFCRAALFDLWPQRKVKRGVVEFLTARGLEDPKQAAVVAAILGDMVRVQGRADFENALESLVRLRLAYPEVASTVTLTGGAT